MISHSCTVTQLILFGTIHNYTVHSSTRSTVSQLTLRRAGRQAQTPTLRMWRLRSPRVASPLSACGVSTLRTWHLRSAHVAPLLRTWRPRSPRVASPHSACGIAALRLHSEVVSEHMEIVVQSPYIAFHAHKFMKKSNDKQMRIPLHMHFRSQDYAKKLPNSHY